MKDKWTSTPHGYNGMSFKHLPGRWKSARNPTKHFRFLTKYSNQSWYLKKANVLQLCCMETRKKKTNCRPPGKLVGKSDGLTELLHIPNSAKVVNIKDPQPGMWSVQVGTSVFTWECVQNYLSCQIPSSWAVLWEDKQQTVNPCNPGMRSQRTTAVLHPGGASLSRITAAVGHHVHIESGWRRISKMHI